MLLLLFMLLSASQPASSALFRSPENRLISGKIICCGGRCAISDTIHKQLLLAKIKLHTNVVVAAAMLS
jgi:hypothetical protein